MKVLMPQEIEVWYIFPAIRREFALALKQKGFSQKEIAKKMNLTESAVSQYLKSKRASTLKFDAQVTKEINKSADRFIRNGNIIKEMLYLSDYMKKNMHICKIHKSFDKVPKSCTLCYK